MSSRVAIFCRVCGVVLMVWGIIRIGWGFLRKRGARSASTQSAVERSVVKIEIEATPPGAEVTLECGHKLRWQFYFPTECKCEICTREVGDLRKLMVSK